MATLGVTASQSAPSAPDFKKQQEAQHIQGLPPTPDGTPVPDDGRIEFEKERQRAASQSANVQHDPPNVESKTASDSHSKDNNGENEDGKHEEDEEPAPTEEQIEAVNRVMKCGRHDYRNILGLKETYANENEERQAVMDAFRELGFLVHIGYNNAKNARAAFQRVVDAAKELGVGEDYIKDMRSWDGKSKILDVRLNESGKPVSTNGDAMDDATMTPPQLTEWHLDVYRKCEPFLNILLDHPDDADARSVLDDANEVITDDNKKKGLKEDQFLVNYREIIPLYKEALPYRARLQANCQDKEARSKIDSINEKLTQINEKYHYPDGWRIVYPPQTTSETQNKEPTSGSAPAGEQTVSRTRGGGSAARTPKFLTITERDGYVLDRGIEKEIEGYLPAGFGHHLLLRYDGKNNLDIYELVRASKFGKKFIERNKHVLKGKKIRLGTAALLEGKSLSTVRIGGVASVRRYSKNEPGGGWERETKTITFWTFGTRDPFIWYRRSTLGQEFGQEKVDQKTKGYRNKAGQSAPMPSTKRGTRKKRKSRAAIASDDEDEGSISVEEEDTSGEEDGEGSDSEDYEDDGNIDDDRAELELLMKHIKELKTRMKKKEEKSKNEGSASPQKSKSKKSKAKQIQVKKRHKNANTPRNEEEEEL